MSNLRDLPAPSICHEDLMLATPGKLFSAKGWIFELKHDGFRCLITKRGGGVRLESRSGRDMSPCFPELVDEISPIRADFVADAELVVLDEQGRPIWERLTARHAIKNPARVRQAAAQDPAALFAFDLLWLNGADFRPRPLLERKAALYGTLPANRRIRYAGHFADSSNELWQLAVQLELEGIVAKDAASAYSAGRSTRWQKIKTTIGTGERAPSWRRPRGSCGAGLNLLNRPNRRRVSGIPANVDVTRGSAYDRTYSPHILHKRAAQGVYGHIGAS
jgi:bifunctional non-homologous end joining protein LigD